MSIKDFFNSADASRNYLSDTDTKDAFKTVESERNVRAIKQKQEQFIPQIDFSQPENFAKYGSAYLYYKSAIEYIHDYYPYDGSDAEINEFFNKLLGVERYIFNNEYPRTNGYAVFSADGWGSQGAFDTGYGLSNTQEYITFYGGPNTSSHETLAQAFSNPNDNKFQHSNLYNESVYAGAGLPSDYGLGTRESNLKSDFNAGVTVEFWLKKPAFGSALTTTKEVVFDMWNSEASASAGYGRMRVELTGSGASPFLITTLSGTAGIYQQSIGSGLTPASLQSFAHYAFAFYNSGSFFVTKLYVNGVLNDTNTAAVTINELNSKGMAGRIGALITASASPAGPIGAPGSGKFSGSLDEFRFWKVRRDSEQISTYYNYHVRGGANSDYSNATLGVYYKFNEGITGDSSIDSTALDYSGRISNGTWIGYGANSRTTASAMVEALAAPAEYLDPIIYSTHSSVSALKTTLLSKGMAHDGNNNNSFVSLVPAWVLEEEEESTSDLRKLTHIAGAYFDKLYLQIRAIPDLKSTNYTTASASPIPFAQHLPQSLGLYMPEIFVDSTVMERFLNRNKDIDFEGDLTETKNLIYLNLYNSLAGIFKSKGTERSVRNIFRCFNLDDRIIKLKTYSDGRGFYLKDNLELVLRANTSVNLNKNGNMAGVVYQKADASNPEALGYISGTYEAGKESRYGMTVEANIIFPAFNGDDTSRDRRFTNISLFGMHEANTASADDTTWFPTDRANFQVSAVRDRLASKNVYFKITSSISPNPFPELTSSLFYDVYDNENWNFSVRLKPDTYPVVDLVTGSSIGSYTLEFRGVNAVKDIIQNSFLLTASIGEATGRKVLRAAKRIYGGARRTNITGSLKDKSDVLLTNMKHWVRYISDKDIDQHLYDIGNAGVSDSFKNFSALDPALSSTDATNLNALALHWNFDNITGSDSSGEFYYIRDLSSGSQELRDNYGWVGGISGHQYTGYGYGFNTDSTGVVNKENINSLKFIDPENPVSSTMIDIYGDQEKVFGTKNIPATFFHAVEKSMYGAISEEMLHFFAGVIDFNNVIGAPVNRYRERYKGLEKLREIFFRKVTTVSNVEKFINYYRWLDDAIAQVIAQVVPASAKFIENSYNIIESHVLERNKYKTPFPTIEFSRRSLEAPVMGVGEKTYNIGTELETPAADIIGAPPVARSRAQPGSFQSSGDAIVDAARRTILNNISLVNNQKDVTLSSVGGITYNRNENLQKILSKPYLLEITRKQNSPATLKGGINFEDNKNIEFTKNALYPAGPVNTDGGVFVPLNVLVAFAEDIEPVKEEYYNNFPNKKIKRFFKTQHGRDWDGGYGPANVKSSFAFPFNVVNSSVTTGYSGKVAANVVSGIDIVNVHNDAYGPDMDTPMQGPFTSYAVGGSQHRHIKLNSGNDNYTNRPEAWKILLGTLTGSGGKIGGLGMAGADYPWPEANAVGVAPYPMTASQKAVFYRDHVAKRPVNIRNILLSTVPPTLGNYAHNYEIVHSVGGYSNPRGFVESPPVLPIQITQAPATSQGRLILDSHRSDSGHFEFIPDYSVGYFTASTNKSIIRSRFSAPGSVEVLGHGYGDIRSNEYSVYNALSYRNLTVRRPYQNISGTVSEATGSGTAGIRVSDIHGNDFGLVAHLQRHSGRFGRDSTLVASPGASINESPAFNKIQRNPRSMIRQNAGGTFYSASQFDNFFVQHQIPRADRQYSWITSSLSPEGHGANLRYYGFAALRGPQAGYYSSSATGYTAYFDFVSGSSVLGKAGTASIYQPTLDLNIYVSEPVDSGGDNNLGENLGSDVGDYYNTDLLDRAGINTAVDLNTQADYFNLLLSKRKGVFGYRAAPINGPVAHPIIRKHRKDNTLTFENNGLKSYTFTPFTERASPISMGINAGQTDIVIKATYGNEKIYFGNEELNDTLLVNPEERTVTPFDQIVKIVRNSSKYSLNWALYSETLFPSRLNEFSAISTKRDGYDNLFWRTSAQGRYDLHKDSILINSYGREVSQSSWPLDEPIDFLTRTTVPVIVPGSPHNELIRSNSAGELQNGYMQVLSGSAVNADRNASTTTAALYARKHMLGGPKTVASPAGPDIPETGSYSGDGFFGNVIDIGAGAAAWEAAAQAGLVIKTGSSFVFQSASSEPWFDTYDDFRSELKRVTRGYAVVPEFRISQHVEDYERYGLKGGRVLDTFEIVGTDANSTTGSFYKDYSNSDFMREFLNIKKKSDLRGAEIRLVCSASIRFNPYKGFYPAQRTIDLVEKFRDSYSSLIMAENSNGDVVNDPPGLSRPLAQALFAPGLLYNTIKSGIAVDYPIVTSPTKFKKEEFYVSAASAGSKRNAWMITATSSVDAQGGYAGGEFWDFRVPFETLIKPEHHINNVKFFDCEPHPSATLDGATASLNGIGSDEIYSKMASNFFAEIANFFLSDGEYTTLKSAIVTDGLRFETGSVYGGRLKFRRSAGGNRVYTYESGASGDNLAYGTYGAKYYNTASSAFESGEFPLPQDPRQAPKSVFKENFTMYSRPTAFGPAISGRPTAASASNSFVTGSCPLDSLSGFNWAYTPPYYNGEAWVDFVFAPTAGTAYDLERILSEIKTEYWRVDPGVATPPGSVPTDSNSQFVNTQLIATYSRNSGTLDYGTNILENLIYEGKNINQNAMQAKASINLFGIERVRRSRRDRFGNEILSENESVGQRWVIQPKFETPMLNFNDSGAHPISSASSTLTLPTGYGSGSVPRGMWHQFGIIEPDPGKGVFVEIGEIPNDWLKYHYSVLRSPSIYNLQNTSGGDAVHQTMKPLTDIVKFEGGNSRKKLGKLADSMTIREAIVAIPYKMSVGGEDSSNQNLNSQRKMFFGIDRNIIDASLSTKIDSRKGDSLSYAGASIRKLIRKMKKYVLPPQFDFINRQEIDPMAMYIFEFKYTFDRDDLSYIWQNVAPRNYKKITKTSQSITHLLDDNQLLTEEDVLGDDTRWMVFKVKQRSQAQYRDKIFPQAGGSSRPKDIFDSRKVQENYPVEFNWPYDYVSFVESVKFEAEILYKEDRKKDSRREGEDRPARPRPEERE